MLEGMDYVKFICRDLWLLLFKKQADRLQTNHKVSGHTAGAFR